MLFFPTLPQHNYLAQVTSNIWGTKFKIVGLASFLPANLGAGKFSEKWQMHDFIYRTVIDASFLLCVFILFSFSDL